MEAILNRTTDVNQGYEFFTLKLIRITLVRKSNCLKPLKLILLNYYCEIMMAKIKNLGIVKMNKILFYFI